jgi:hypothetical protein
MQIMTTSKAAAHKIIGFVVVVLTSLILTSCIPITIPLDVVVLSDVQLDLGALEPGQAIPAEYGSFDYEFCETWPSLDDLKAELRKVAGSIVDFVQVTSVQPELVELTASNGSFSSLTEVSLTIVLPDESTVVVSATVSADGKTLTIQPTDTLDLVELLQTYGGAESWIKLLVSAAGNVPDPIPTVSVRVIGSVTVEL